MVIEKDAAYILDIVMVIDVTTQDQLVKQESFILFQPLKNVHLEKQLLDGEEKFVVQEEKNVLEANVMLLEEYVK